jgi:hypothetical protein
LNWQISEDCSWLYVEPVNGSSTGETDDVNLSVDISGLQRWVYTCNLTVSDPCASNNPQAAVVTLHVKDSDGILYVPSEYSTIQEALTVAWLNDEIWVAQGTYKPDANSLYPTGTNNRDATFQLKNGVTLYGGFPAGGGTWESRDPSVYVTILSGDIGITGNKNDNSYHVVTGSGTDSTAILDGFTITAGNANGSDSSWYKRIGGGMYNYYDGSPTVTNCNFSENSANLYGGGMFNYENSNPVVTNCAFNGNSSNYGGGMYNCYSSPTITNCTFNGNSAIESYGGGMENLGSNPVVTNCTFSGNSARFGGGIYNYGYSSPTVTNCIFSSNSADRGGGMYNDDSDPTVTNCTFSGNSAKYDGGGMNNHYHSRPTVTNCTFSGNSAVGGGGMHTDSDNPTLTNCTFTGNSASSSGGGMENNNSSPALANCILWGNTAPTGSQLHNDGTSSPSVTFSDVQGGWTGTGNINADPCFVAGPNGNYYLSQIASGQAFDSPCVDAGSDTAANLGMDLFTTRTDDIGDTGIVDMGYHYLPLFPNPDLNGDSFIDLIDYAILANQWMLRKLSFDIAPGTGDGIVNFLDYAIFANGWLNVNDMHDLEDFTSQWLLRGAYNADIAPPPHGDGLVDFSDLAFLCDNWLEIF